jgi:hypothetical protein
MKRIKNSNRTTMRQDGMESISLLMIAVDLLRQINFEDVLMLFQLFLHYTYVENMSETVEAQ